jgi:outer membrane immunogenic protein
MRVSLAIAAGLLTVVAGAAQAADLPRRTAARAPAPASYAPAFTWTGGYVGANAGYGWGKHTKGGSHVMGKPRGALVGVTAGYNQQYGNIVAGVEGDIGRTAQVDDRHRPASYGKSHLKTLATARARIGVAMDRTLIYATGGYAGGAVRAKYEVPGAGMKETKWLNGYAVGAGVEYAATNNVTVKGEYLYTDLSAKRFGGGQPGAPVVKTGFQDHILRTGVNYKF